jgi:phosphate uptake regulator
MVLSSKECSKEVRSSTRNIETKPIQIFKKEIKMETNEIAVEDYAMLQIQSLACLKESYNSALKKDWSRAILLAKMASEYTQRLHQAYESEKNNG